MKKDEKYKEIFEKQGIFFEKSAKGLCKADKICYNGLNINDLNAANYAGIYFLASFADARFLLARSE